MTACTNNKKKAATGKNNENDRDAGCKKATIPSYKIPSEERTTGEWGCKNIGNLIRIPTINNTKRLNGLFCLNIAITKIGYLPVTSIPVSQSKYNSCC